MPGPPIQHIPLSGGASLELILVEGSTFLMGSEAYRSEQPAHKVTLSSFYVSKYPVAQAVWKAIMGPENSPFAFPGDRRPAERISWYGAIVFCNRLSEHQGRTPFYYADASFRQAYGKMAAGWELPNKGEVFLNPVANGFRLPTEAEWEYAARGGKKSEGYEYSGSNRLKEAGWYRDNSYGETKPVGMKAPNELGLYDMSGNVWEWCWDWFDENYYEECHKLGTARNPQGPAKGTLRVLRGGSWSNNPGGCRCSIRFIINPGDRIFIAGFRLVLPLQSGG